MSRSLPAGDSTVIMHGAMSELQNVQHLLEEAKRAADAGDLAAADALLRNAARIQESELGPLHPELANTVNNLAMVAEMSGRLPDAEAYYRRASPSRRRRLRPDDPVLAVEPQEPRGFLPRTRAALRSPPAPAVTVTEPRNIRSNQSRPITPSSRRNAFGTRSGGGCHRGCTDVHARVRHRRSLFQQDPGSRCVVCASAPCGARWQLRRSALLALSRPRCSSPAWSAREPQTSDRAVEPAAPHRPNQRRRPPPSPHRRRSNSQPRGSRITPDSGDAAPASREIGWRHDARDLATVPDSFLGQNWRCDPADQSVAPGPLVLYTRVKSSRDGVVIHQWYSGKHAAEIRSPAGPGQHHGRLSHLQPADRESRRALARRGTGPRPATCLYEQRVSVR